MYNSEHPKLLRNTTPIMDPEVISFIKGVDEDNFLFNSLQNLKLKDAFLNEYFKWVQSSNLNNLKGLKAFDNLAYVHGTSQAFDAFYAENKNRRFRCFKGDFFYHSISWRNNYTYSFLDDDELKTNDAVVISIPFSDNGFIHPDTNSVIEKCNQLQIPVLIDLAYYNLAREINFNLDEPCISTVTFSLSKGFRLLDRLRIGMRCKKEFNDDPVDVMNSFDMINKPAAALALKIMKKFSPDHNQIKFFDKQKEICEKFNFEQSKCVVFGLGDETYSKYNRGSIWNRVCISNFLID
tara:strand:- start:960 stop:1841 length:882 start_codon:yes stop_codon:yes gene_type:complete